MKSAICVWGSCVSRDIFMSQHTDYKKYFDLELSYQRSSIISFMQPAVEFDLEDITILPHNFENDFRTKCLCDDLSKSFLEEIPSKNLDFFLFDIFFDVHLGVLRINDEKYITNNVLDIYDVNLLNKFDTKVVNYEECGDKYLNLWKSCFDMFLDYFEDNCPDTTIIFNQHRLAYKILKEDSTIVEHDKFKEEVDKNNKYFKPMEDYIENKGILTLKFDEDTFLDENHVWGLLPFHYQKSFYVNRLNELVEIKNMVEK